MKLLNVDTLLEAGLYDVADWFVEHYPEDIYVNPDHPVTKIRDLFEDILEKRL